MANLKRKVTKHGKHSLSVTLPKQWAELNGIKKNDSISVTLSADNSLVLRKAEVQPNETA